MTALIVWAEATLLSSTMLMLLVLAVRTPVRRFAGPRLAYALWALPAIRMIIPVLPLRVLDELPAVGTAASKMSILFVGPHDLASDWDGPALLPFSAMLFAVWAAGAIGLLASYAIRHVVFCRRLRAVAIMSGWIGDIKVITTDVDGPLAFGVVRRFIAVPHGFVRDFTPGERDLALAHERAHHLRGDLLANWASLVVLAVHWWNPVAWTALRAFRRDQECAADAYVLAGQDDGAVAVYAQLLAKVAGIGALPVCNLNARSNLKGRLMTLRQKPHSSGRLVFGAAALTLLGSAALAATASSSPSANANGRQVVTIGVKPDGSGGYALVVGDTAVAPRAALPGGMTLPADFDEAGGCDLKANAKPVASVIKGFGKTQTYTVMCGSAAPAPVRTTLSEGLGSLKTMRASVASQHQASFPEAERLHALRAIDRSMREVEATLGLDRLR